MCVLNSVVWPERVWPGRVWSEGVEPSSPAWRAGVLAVGRRPLDAREGVSPPSRGLQPRASILGHRAWRCQGGGRTLVFRVTAGRPCLWTTWHRCGYRDGESNPGFRGEGPASRPLDDRGESSGSGATRTPGAITTRTCFSGLAPDPAGSLSCSHLRASPARFERATPAFGGPAIERNDRAHPLELRRVLKVVWLVSTAGVEPAVSGFAGRCLRPLGYVDVAPPTGFAPATSGFDGPAPLSELRRLVFLLRARPGSRTRPGEGPVPHLSGVTRGVGRGGVEPPVSE